MLQLVLFFVVGLWVVGFLLTPFAKRAEKAEQRLKERWEETPVYINKQEPEQVSERKSESILDQLAMEKKEKTEIEDEKEVIFRKTQQDNRRDAFRVLLFDVTCDYTIEPSGEKGKGVLIDISTTGMKLHTAHNFSFQPNMHLMVSFMLNGKRYYFNGVPLRKQELNPYRYEYGILFQHEEKEQRETLFRALWEEHRKRNRQII